MLFVFFRKLKEKLMTFIELKTGNKQICFVREILQTKNEISNYKRISNSKFDLSHPESHVSACLVLLVVLVLKVEVLMVLPMKLLQLVACLV